MAEPKVLIVEDEADFQALVQSWLGTAAEPALLKRGVTVKRALSADRVTSTEAPTRPGSRSLRVIVA